MATATGTERRVDDQLQQLMINTIRTLSIDGVQKANSGHPGAPLGAAPAGYTLYTKVMRHNPHNPDWPNRDRFVLSAGHASMLLYSLLYLTGYDLSLDDIKQFRQWESKTPGHPEYRLTPGVETSTGPLGQGFANSVGMAIAEAFLAAHYNRPGLNVVDHYVYGICSDGDLQEGVASEAASLAGHLQLGKLIFLYDDNNVQLSGPSNVSFTENVPERFRAYGWHVTEVQDGNDVDAIYSAITEAQGVSNKPSLIPVHTVIGYASPKAGSYKVHGEPLGEDAVKETKRALGWDYSEPFTVPREALEEFRQAVPRGEREEQEWNEIFQRWKGEYPDLANEWEHARTWTPPDGWDAEMPSWQPDPKGIATREAGGEAMNAIAKKVPFFLGGDADLTPSTKNSLIGFGDFQPGSYEGRNLHFGVREHAMGSIVNGMMTNGFLRAFGATFFNFSDYQRPAVRMASIMEVPSIFLYTHDSVLLGEDGPTHEPVEHLMSLRAMPNLITMRPGDANETADAWHWIMSNWEAPVALVLTRQKVPVLDRSGRHGDLAHGAYILSDADGGAPDVILIGTGSELSLCVQARDALAGKGVKARVVSFPSWELFERQPKTYQDAVLPPAIGARVSVEAGATLGWCKWIGEHGVSIGVDRFGASAPASVIAEKLGLTAENVTQHALKLLGR
ncbi:MAG TPA: transketolase [Chloroflexi bacterium]|jgi:transketolase|nr:transketolase [Chloroflexota bacterium]